jgi:DNA-binding transcriptional MerR regulator
MADELLTIGELAHRTGVATSALRYWEELGLLPAPARVSGQRRYAPSAAELVGEILLLRDVGFTLREVKELRAARSSAGDGWRELHQRKIAELDHLIAQAQAARTAIAHGMACPHDDIHDCPTFRAGVAARLAGTPFDEAHRELDRVRPRRERVPAEPAGQQGGRGHHGEDGAGPPSREPRRDG